MFSLNSVIPKWPYDFEFQSPQFRHKQIRNTTGLDSGISVPPLLRKKTRDEFRQLWLTVRANAWLELLEWNTSAIDCSNGVCDIVNEFLHSSTRKSKLVSNVRWVGRRYELLVSSLVRDRQVPRTNGRKLVSRLKHWRSQWHADSRCACVDAAGRRCRGGRGGWPRPVAWPKVDRRAGSVAAPQPSNNSTIGFWPNFAAQPSGVEQMSSSRASRSAPCSMNCWAFSTSPLRANWCSGVMCEPIGLAGVHSVREEQFVELARFGADRPSRESSCGAANPAGSAASSGRTLHALRRRRSPVRRGRWPAPGLAANTAAAVLTSPS